MNWSLPLEEVSRVPPTSFLNFSLPPSGSSFIDGLVFAEERGRYSRIPDMLPLRKRKDGISIGGVKRRSAVEEEMSTSMFIKCVTVEDGAVGKTCMLVSYTINTFPTVITVEPGCYFIDALLFSAVGDSNVSEFFNREKLDKYKNFGGVRIESDVYVTADGCKNITNCPRETWEIEAVMAGVPWPLQASSSGTGKESCPS